MNSEQLPFVLQDKPHAPVFIVGAGITGCVLAEQIATRFDRPVVLLEKRAEIGGNSRAEIDPETGIEVHIYGSHIFHTTNRQVWDYIRRFTGFNAYQHKVLLRSGGRVWTMPINLKTINDFYGAQLSPSEAQELLAKVVAEEGDLKPRNLEEKAISLVGRGLYDRMIREYTAKQWGRDPRELPESIINRLPLRFSYDGRYFETDWQGIPDRGFERLFLSLTSNPRIQVRTGVDFFSVRKTLPSDSVVIYTGMIDRLFDDCFGPLDWRSLRFERETLAVRDFQGTSVMNYGDASVPFTRIHEFKHYHPEWRDSFNKEATIICREHPADYGPGLEPFYPVNDDSNRRRCSKYMEEVDRTPNLFVAGRLGSYRYLDMDGAIAAALRLVSPIETFHRGKA